MKRYKRYFKEEDSLKDLIDESIPQKLVDFIKKNPFPKDHEGIHKFAEEELKKHILDLGGSNGAPEEEPV